MRSAIQIHYDHTLFTLSQGFKKEVQLGDELWKGLGLAFIKKTSPFSAIPFSILLQLLMITGDD